MKNEFIFLGYFISDTLMKELINEDKFPQIQTHKFTKNLIKGLEKSGVCNFTYITTRPVSDYPYYPQKIIKGGELSIHLNNTNINVNEIPFINFSIVKVISRFISSLILAIDKFKNKKNKKGVIVYSVSIPFMLTGLIISKIYKIDFICIWTDPPSVKSQRDNILKKYLRAIEYRMSKSIMAKASKVIALTEYLAIDFAPNVPYIVVEGIIDESEINTNLLKKPMKKFFKVIYTGTLDKRYGIENLIEAFKKIDNKNILLEVYGKGDYEEEIKNVSSIYNNIDYYGFVSDDKIKKIQGEAGLLINVRPISQDYVKYSFPSKTLEYMCSGTPVLTTKLPGIPEDYFNYIYNIPNNDIDTIIKEIKRIYNIDSEISENMTKRAINFVKTKNYIKQGEKIIKFINS